MPVVVTVLMATAEDSPYYSPDAHAARSIPCELPPLLHVSVQIRVFCMVYPAVFSFPANVLSISLQCLRLCVFVALLLTSVEAEDWPQAAGPHHNYRVSGRAAAEFSVTRDQHVVWRTPLPNTGESTPVVVGDRVFVTCHTPMSADAASGRDLLGLCFDARSGRELWRRVLPAARETDMASGFSDNTAASPVSDGRLVCFVNVGGSITTFDLEGRQVWQRKWVPFGRHHARQQEPILLNGRVILLKTLAENLLPVHTTKEGAKPLGRDRSLWTHLHCYDLATGKLQWVAEDGTSVHSASLLNFLPDGRPAILTGRGGGHQPPEEPYGLSLIAADTGRTIRAFSIPDYAAHQNAVWRDNLAPLFVGMQHQLGHLLTGEILSEVSLSTGVTLRQRKNGAWHTSRNAALPDHKRQRPTTYHTNILAGEYHYFRAHNDFLLGRVHLPTQSVEYLQVPVQVQRDAATETLLWDKALPNDVRNNDGFVVYQDQRAAGNGWGHVSAASPILIGDLLYMPTMVGTVLVIRWNCDVLNEDALVSVSDLGPAGQTWSLSSLAFANQRIYARTLKELICIGQE